MEVDRMSYWEVRMINNDLFKAAEPPDEWKEHRVIEKVPGSKVGNYIMITVEFTDVRNNKPVLANPDLISSIREVSDKRDTTVGLIADDEFVDDTVDLAGQILNRMLGGGARKEEIITIDNKESE